MVSRRTERTFSDLACGSGGHHIRTLCPRSAVCGQDGGIPEPHPCLHAHEFQILAANRLSSRHDGRLGRSGRPDASACAPVSLSAIRRACRQCMEVASCTKGCAGCHNHTNRAEAYGVSVHCWCERGELWAEAGGDSGVHRAGQICRRRLPDENTRRMSRACPAPPGVRIAIGRRMAAAQNNNYQSPPQ